LFGESKTLQTSAVGTEMLSRDAVTVEVAEAMHQMSRTLDVLNPRGYDDASAASNNRAQRRP
jgi:hypothetical protein